MLSSITPTRLLLTGSALLFLTGCPRKDDGGPPPTGDLTVTVMDGADPAEGADVVIQDSGGAVVDHVQTDANGQVTHEVTSGDMVTVVSDDGFGGFDIETVAGVAPGDALVFGGGFTTFEQLGTLEVSLPGSASGAVSYDVQIGCASENVSDPGTPVSLIIWSDCPANVDILAVARDGNDAPVAAISAIGVAVDTQGGTTQVSLSPWVTTFDTFTLDLTNAPPGSLAALPLVGVTSGGYTYTLTDILSQYDFVSEGGSVSFDVDLPPGMGTGMLYGTYLAFGSGQTIDGMSGHAVGTASTPSTASIDLAADLPPRHHGLTVDSSDPARVSLSWQSEGSTSGMDVASVDASWDDGSNYIYWTVTAPPSIKSFKFPELPDALSAARPTANMTMDDPTVFISGTSVLNGYADVRNNSGDDPLENPPAEFTADFISVGGFGI